jgi:hypothetical protein
MEVNFAFYLSLVLAAFACTGLLLAGSGKWYGWAVGLAAQPAWATYAIVTKGYGLLITCLMYGGVNGWNLWRWWKNSRIDFKPPKVIGQITSVKQTPAGLEVRGKFNDDFNYNPSPTISGLMAQDYLNWKAEKDGKTKEDS